MVVETIKIVSYLL